MKQTAVEWLEQEILSRITRRNPHDTIIIQIQGETLTELVEQAKVMEQEQLHSYAEFAIRCDRKDMKILNFEDWIKLENFKSE